MAIVPTVLHIMAIDTEDGITDILTVRVASLAATSAMEEDKQERDANMDRTIAILMGLQGSGKSTFYATHLAEDFVRVNLDTLKTRHREKLLVEECIANGQSYAIDNTNPTKSDRERYIASARAAGYRIIGYFIESKIKDCMQRNALREGDARVPEKAIAATSNKLQIPSYDEGFDELYFVKNDGKTMTVEEWRR